MNNRTKSRNMAYANAFAKIAVSEQAPSDTMTHKDYVSVALSNIKDIINFVNDYLRQQYIDNCNKATKELIALELSGFSNMAAADKAVDILVSLPRPDYRESVIRQFFKETRDIPSLFAIAKAADNRRSDLFGAIGFVADCAFDIATLARGY